MLSEVTGAVASVEVNTQLWLVDSPQRFTVYRSKWWAESAKVWSPRIGPTAFCKGSGSVEPKESHSKASKGDEVCALFTHHLR